MNFSEFLKKKKKSCASNTTELINIQMFLGFSFSGSYSNTGYHATSAPQQPISIRVVLCSLGCIQQMAPRHAYHWGRVHYSKKFGKGTAGKPSHQDLPNPDLAML